MKQAYAWNAYLAEALGTFLFFFIGIGAGYAVVGAMDPASSTLLVALAHGLVLAAMVSAFGAVSGGHFNPAVTFGLWIAGKIDTVKGIGYAAAQLLGGVIAAALAFYVFSDRAGIEATMAVPALGDSIDILRGIVVEAGITMVLLAAVFGTAVDKRSAKLGGLVIGIALAAGIMMAAGLTGGAANPTRWLAPAIVAADFTNAIVWIVGPLLGAAIMGAVYRVLFLPQADDEEAEAAAAAE